MGKGDIPDDAWKPKDQSRYGGNSVLITPSERKSGNNEKDYWINRGEGISYPGKFDTINHSIHTEDKDVPSMYENQDRQH